MKKSTLWLIVGIAALFFLSTLGCCFGMGMLGKSERVSSISSSAAVSNVDLEKLTKEFEGYVSSGKTDINGFEAAVNDKSKGIYKGAGHVDVTMAKSGAVVGYVDKDANSTYDAAGDEKVFELNIDDKQKKVVANDRHDNYYRHSPMGSGFFTGLLIGNMLTGHRSYYRGGSYSAPSSARYRQSGYYNRMRSSSSSTRSTRSGSRAGSRSSFGSGTRSGSRSGGFGSGK